MAVPLREGGKGGAIKERKPFNVKKVPKAIKLKGAGGWGMGKA